MSESYFDMRKKQLLDLIEQKLLENNGSEQEMICLKALKNPGCRIYLPK